MINKKLFLVLENSPEDAFLIEHAFSLLEKCTSHTCHTASDARAYLQGHGRYSDRSAHPIPDAVISDLHLGAESGLEFFAWMRGLEPFQNIPAILFTGSGNPRELKIPSDVPNIQIVQKPMDLAALNKIIDSFCESI